MLVAKHPVHGLPPWFPSDPRPAQRAEPAIILPPTPPVPPSANPKDRIGRSKAPLQLVPASFIAATAVGLYNGATKYGIANWRENDVAASVYVGAIMRHLLAWYDGDEGTDPDDEVHNLYGVAAGLAILIDAMEGGFLVDDRPTPNLETRAVFDFAASEVKRIDHLREEQRCKSSGGE